ncbi:MAG: hypothetical protein ACRDP9_26330 [Kribbellaceae bacterium]
MSGMRWAGVAALLAAGLGMPAATATATYDRWPEQPEVVTTQPTKELTNEVAAEPVISLTAVAAPTNEVIVAPGSLMSTYGHLRLYDGTAKATPLVNRFVYVETRPLSTPAAPYKAISTGRTTATGYYYANWTADADVNVRVSFVGGAGAPSKITYLGQVRPQKRPTYLDGVARPTSPTSVIRLDTKMSSFGHLRVLYSNAQLGPYAGQRVRVQLRAAVEPELVSGPPYETVGEAVTTSTGYFYTNWRPSIIYFRNTDVSVRLIFSSSYRTVATSVLDLGVIHVQ